MGMYMCVCWRCWKEKGGAEWVYSEDMKYKRPGYLLA